MKLKLPILILGLSTLAMAAKATNFAGTWRFAVAKSKNVGMMAEMKITQTIEQSASSIDVTTHTNFQGRDEDSKKHFDLTGKEVTNPAPMGGTAQTVSKWNGGKLITTWTSDSPIAGGPKVVRTETWSLSQDGKLLTVESVRGSNPPLVMIFEKSE